MDSWGGGVDHWEDLWEDLWESFGDWMGIGKFTGGCFQGGLGVSHPCEFRRVSGRLGWGGVFHCGNCIDCLGYF